MGDTPTLPILRREEALEQVFTVLTRRVARKASYAAGVVCLAALLAVSVAQAKPKAGAVPATDKVTIVSLSSTSFNFTYTNERSLGSPAVNGATIQITSGNPAILQSVLFAGTAGKATGAQDAFIFYPIAVPAGMTVSGSGTTNAQLPAGTTFKFFFTTDAFATTANTNPVDATLSSAVAPARERLKLKGTEKLVQAAIRQEGEALQDGPKSEIESDELGSLGKLQAARNKLRRARELGEIDAATELPILHHIETASEDDVKAGIAAHRNDTNSAKHWLTKARVEKETALRLIVAALKKP